MAIAAQRRVLLRARAAASSKRARSPRRTSAPSSNRGRRLLRAQCGHGTRIELDEPNRCSEGSISYSRVAGGCPAVARSADRSTIPPRFPSAPSGAPWSARALAAKTTRRWKSPRSTKADRLYDERFSAAFALPTRRLAKRLEKREMRRRMDASGSHEAKRQYYDAFAAAYERGRGGNDPGGYHELLDELEAGYVKRFGQGRDVLEVGCGTGLVLLRLREFARQARGVDLSPGMLEKAQQRGLDVTLGSATGYPPRQSCRRHLSSRCWRTSPKSKRRSRDGARHSPRRHGLGGVLTSVQLARLGQAARTPARSPRAPTSTTCTRASTRRAGRKLTPPGCVFVAPAAFASRSRAACGLMKTAFGRRLFEPPSHALCDSPFSDLRASTWPRMKNGARRVTRTPPRRARQPVARGPATARAHMTEPAREPAPSPVCERRRRRAALKFFNAAFRAEGRVSPGPRAGGRGRHWDPELSEVLRLYGTKRAGTASCSPFLTDSAGSGANGARDAHPLRGVRAAKRMDTIVLTNLMFETIGSTTYRRARQRLPAGGAPHAHDLTRDEPFTSHSTCICLRRVLERDPSCSSIAATLLVVFASLVLFAFGQPPKASLDRIETRALIRRYALELAAVRSLARPRLAPPGLSCGCWASRPKSSSAAPPSPPPASKPPARHRPRRRHRHRHVAPASALPRTSTSTKHEHEHEH